MNRVKTYRQQVLDGDIDDPDFLIADSFTENLNKSNTIINIVCVILVVSGIAALLIWG